MSVGRAARLARTDRRSFVIRMAREDDTARVLQFHQEHLTPHLWPRTFAEFTKLAEDESLFQALDQTGGDETLVGLCYVMRAHEPGAVSVPRDEFGGVYVADDCRKLGLASVLGTVALSNHFVWDPPPGRLVAHVHRDNPLPRRMLETQLGFVRAGVEVTAAAPGGMERDAGGGIVGDLYEFDRRALLHFADWLESLATTMFGKDSLESALRVELPLADRFRKEAVSALRALGRL